jgi:hypothetical protein
MGLFLTSSASTEGSFAALPDRRKPEIYPWPENVVFYQRRDVKESQVVLDILCLSELDQALAKLIRLIFTALEL